MEIKLIKNTLVKKEKAEFELGDEYIRITLKDYEIRIDVNGDVNIISNGNVNDIDMKIISQKVFKILNKIK